MKAIFFDADDTLWNIFTHYVDAMKDLAFQMAKVFGISADYAYTTIYQTNIETTQKYGCTRHSFPTAIVKAYVKLANEQDITITSDDILGMYKAADSIHNQNIELKPGVGSTVSTLNRSGYICKILTLGDEVIQSAKIYRSGIWQFIHESYIVPKKDKETYEEIARCLPCSGPPIMIGNSIRNDINPALQAGWYAIHIPCGEWELEHDALVEHEEGKFFTVGNIKEVIEVIDRIYGGSERV